METNKEMPTAEEFIREKIRNSQEVKGQMNGLWTYKVTGEQSLRWAKEYSDLVRDYHLSKQAEVIAEKVVNDMADEISEPLLEGTKVFIKQSILQASEEYIKSIK